MRDYLRTYHGKMIVCGPVFVGSGREITKKEYVFTSPSRNQVGVVDQVALYSYLAKKNLVSKYEEFILNDRRMDLFSWLKSVNLGTEDIENCFKYKVSMAEPDSERAKWTVMEAIKDPYGLPYIPGSSIKGMLRTVLLAAKIKEGKLSKADINEFAKKIKLEKGGRNYYLKRESAGIEAEIFNTLNNKDNKNDAVNDMLSGLVVGDSKPLKMDNMILCPKVEVQPDGNEHRINILRECIKPGTIIEFDITIDSTKCNEDAESISNAVEQFDKIYTDCFLSAFEMDGSLPANSVFIGGGSGFLSKTFIYPMLGKEEGIKATQEIFYKTNVDQKHGHNKDVQYGVSPHILKETVIDGEHYQFGLCMLSLE